MRNLRLLFLVGLAAGFISEKFFVSSQSSFPLTDDLYLEGRTSGDFPLDDEDDEDHFSGSGSGDYSFTEFTDQEDKSSTTTISSQMVPSPPQPTAGSPHNPPTTAADSQHLPTTVKDTKITPGLFPDDNSEKEKVESVYPTADWFTSSLPSETTKFGTKDSEEDNSLDERDLTTAKTIRDEVVEKEINNEILNEYGRGSRMIDTEPSTDVTSENLWERTEVLAAVIACGVVGFLCAVFLLAFLAYRMKKKDEGSYDLGDTKLSNTQYQRAPTKEFYA